MTIRHGPSTPAWLHSAHRTVDSTARDERRRRPVRRRLAVDRVAGLLRQGPRARVGGHPGARPPLRARARLPAQRRSAGAAARRLARRRAARPRHDQPVLQPRAARRPARGRRQAGYIVVARRHRRTTAAGRRSPSRRCAPGPWTATCSSRSRRPEALGPDEHVVLMETEAPRRPSVRFDAEGGAAAAFEHLRRARPPPHRPSRRRLRRALTFQLREEARRARAARGRPRPRRPAARDSPPIAIDDARDDGAARCSTRSPPRCSATTT